MTSAAIVNEIPPGPFPWHVDAMRALSARAELPHALLLTGDTAIGKRLFADVFAARLLCAQPGDFACGKCKGCLLLAAGTHPDLFVLTPETMRPETDDSGDEDSGKKGRKPSSAIRVDDVRALIAFAAQTALMGGRRIIIADPAHALNLNAANALLKTLEEPGTGILFLLVSDAPAQMPATIRSRCQLLRLPSPTPGEARAWLAGVLGGDQARATALLAAAGGPSRALRLADDDEWATLRRDVARALVDALTGMAPPTAFASAASKATKPGDKREKATEPLLLDWLPGFLSDAVLLASGADANRLRNVDLQQDLARLVESRGTQPLFSFADDIARLRAQMQSASGSGLNRQLLWEEVILRWSPRHRAK